MAQKEHGKTKKTGGTWEICEVCGLHKPDVQYRTKRSHISCKWACGDCYKKAVKSDKTFVERLRETRPQRKRRKRAEKEKK